jgi:hypothetical protein
VQLLAIYPIPTRTHRHCQSVLRIINFPAPWLSGSGVPNEKKTKLQNALPLLQALVLSFFIVVLSPGLSGLSPSPIFPLNSHLFTAP